MSPENLSEKPKGDKRNQKNFSLAVDEIKIERSIHNLLNIVQKIERMQPWSKRAKVIRKEIGRQHKRLEEIRENKSA